MFKQCTVCGKTFEAKIANALTCSQECRKEYDRRRSRQYQREHYIAKALPVEPPSELQKLINRKVAVAKGKRGGYQAFCHTCGKDFEPAFPKEKYCSDECRQQSTLWRLYMGYPELFNKFFRPLLGE